MRFILSFVLGVISLFVIPLQAGWIKTYGGVDNESGNVVQTTSDDGFVIFGNYSSGSGMSDMWILKTDTSGDTTWTKTYGGEEPEYCYTGIEINNGGFIFAGGAKSFGNGGFDAWLLRTDQTGDTLWTKTYGGPANDLVYSLQQTDDGGYIMTGFRDGPNEYLAGNMWLVKIDSDGNTLWTKTWGDATTTDLGSHVSQTSDGGFIISCNALYSTVTSDAVVLMKTDAAGDSVWTYRSGLDVVYYVLQTPANAFVATGQTEDGDLVLFMVDSEGNLLWKKIYGDLRDNHRDLGHCVKETSDGGYVVAGCYSRFSSQDGDAWLLKTDSEGDTSWTRVYGNNPQYDRASWVLQTPDKGYILTGSTETWSSGGSDLFIMKTDSLGIVSSVEEPLTPPSSLGWQLVSAIGSTVTLRYSDKPGGFQAVVFDASGRMVDELYSRMISGTLTWGEGHSPGVYFLRFTADESQAPKKIILVK